MGDDKFMIEKERRRGETISRILNLCGGLHN